MNKIIIKILDSEIWIYKDNKLIKNKTTLVMKDNFIVNNTNLYKQLKKILNNLKLKNKIFQNKYIILINKLYCETNLSVLKDIMYNLGITNYSFKYEEDLYSNLFDNVLCIWNDNGVYKQNNYEIFININDLKNINFPKEKVFLITSNSKIINDIKKILPNIIVYENTIDSIFKIKNI